MSIFSGPSTNFANADNKVRLNKLMETATLLVSAMDNAVMDGQMADGGFWIPQAVSDRIDGRKEALRELIGELR